MGRIGGQGAGLVEYKNFTYPRKAGAYARAGYNPAPANDHDSRAVVVIESPVQAMFPLVDSSVGNFFYVPQTL